MAPGAAVNCAGAASCGRQEDGRTPDVNGVVNGTCEHPLTRGSTSQHEQRASRWSDETERTAEPYLGPLSGVFKTGVSSGPAQAGPIPVRLREPGRIRTVGATKSGWMHARDSTT